MMPKCACGAALLDGLIVCHVQDAVARAPKFLGLYKRAGQRVHINHYGDMMVRPSAIQVSLIKAPCGEYLRQPMPPLQSNMSALLV